VLGSAAMVSASRSGPRRPPTTPAPAMLTPAIRAQGRSRRHPDHQQLGVRPCAPVWARTRVGRFPGAAETKTPLVPTKPAAPHVGVVGQPVVRAEVPMAERAAARLWGTLCPPAAASSDRRSGPCSITVARHLSPLVARRPLRDSTARLGALMDLATIPMGPVAEVRTS
jgi:hypothetical protein